jgi:CubicO group peptidase (beta-lactamase class C family)
MRSIYLTLLILFSTSGLYASEQARSETAVTPDLTGDSGILFWTPDQQVTGYSSMAELYPTRSIQGHPAPSELPKKLTNLERFTYRLDGQVLSVADYMQSHRTAGLLVIHKGDLKVERYGLGHLPQNPWVSFSVTKSVVSMLYGAAIKDGFVESLDTPISEYIPVFSTGSYAGVTIKNILQMASGVAWNEDYADPASDIVNLPTEQAAGFRYMNQLPRVAEPGTRFNYNTGETNIAGVILAKATGKTLSDYASEKIFLPGGLSNNANWLLDGPNGREFAGCCISANLRDYGRLGLFALANTKMPSNGNFTDNWMQQSTAPSEGYAGYGYFWWLLGDGIYAAEGVFGQYLVIDTNRDLIAVLQSAWLEAWSDDLEARTLAFIEALSDYVVDQE